MSSGQRSKQAATIDAARPAGMAAAITPSDTVELSNGATRGLYVGVTGDLAVMMQEDSVSVVFKAAAVGYHPLQVRLVLATGTTATNILALR